MRSSGVSASVMYRKSMHRTISSGVISHSNRQTGLRSDFAQRSQNRIDHRRRCEVDHPLLGANPSKLAVTGHAAPECAHVGSKGVERLAN
jgi:hypothetical protein